jgi:hypothetical protein
MVQRLIGRNAVSALQLARETGVVMADKPRHPAREWTVAQKARVISEASKLAEGELIAYLEREGVKLAEYESWRIALEEGGRASASTRKLIRKLERELARKEKALAEAAALLVLKKKVETLYGGDEDDDTDEGNEK